MKDIQMQISKHNEIIDTKIDEMSKNEWRLFSLSIAQIDSKNLLNIKEIKESDLIFDIFDWELKEYFQIDVYSHFGNFYNDVKSLSKKQIGNIPNTKSKSFKMINIFSYFDWNDDDKKLEFKLNIDAVRYFAGFSKNFFQYYIDKVLKFKSKYSFQLYELLKRFDNQIIEENYISFSLDELYEIFNIGKTKSYYKKGQNGKPNFKEHQYSIFKSKVLEVAKIDIDTNTDMKIKFIPVKSSRKVVGVKFLFIEYSKTKDILQKIEERKLKQKDIEDYKDKYLKEKSKTDSLFKTIDNLKTYQNKLEKKIDEQDFQHQEKERV